MQHLHNLRSDMRSSLRALAQAAVIAAIVLGLGSATSLLFAGNKGDAAPVVKPVWPPPPEDPRLTFVQTIAGPEDVGARLSFWGKVADFLVSSRARNERLVRPLGLALDEAGNLCVADAGAPAVCFYDLGRKRCQRWERIGQTSLLSPVAVAKKGDTFFVADTGLRKVLAFDSRGKLRFEMGQGLEQPSGLALCKEQLFVTDAHAHCVLVFDLRGHLLSRFGKRGINPGEFNFPTHIAADNQGRLFVTDSMNFRVQMFDAQGRHLGVIGSEGDSSGHFSRPKGVAVDSFGHVYVVDALFDNIQIFDQQGRFLLDVGEPGTLPGEFWLPTGLVISSDNRIFVADSYNRRVQVLQYLGNP